MVDPQRNDGRASDDDPSRDVLAVLQLRRAVEDAWLRQFKQQQRRPPNDAERTRFRERLYPLASLPTFFYGASDFGLYKEVSIFRADDPDRTWRDLPHLVRELQDVGSGEGVLLTSRSGSGKTVGEQKTFFDCLYAPPAEAAPRPVAAESPPQSPTAPQPLLAGCVPCWLRSSREVPEQQRLESLARREFDADRPLDNQLQHVDDQLVLQMLARLGGLIPSSLPDEWTARRRFSVAEGLDRMRLYFQFGPPLLLFLDLNHEQA